MSHDAQTLREGHRDAVRNALGRAGLSCPAVARALGVREYMVDAWLRAHAPNCTPAWAVHRLCVLYADFAAALSHELGGTNDTTTDDEAPVLSLVRAYGEALHVVATPARRTPEGARAALVALARVEGAQARVVPALRRAA